MSVGQNGGIGQDARSSSQLGGVQEQEHPSTPDTPESRAVQVPSLGQIALLCLAMVLVALLTSTGIEVVSWVTSRTSAARPRLIGLMVSEVWMLLSALLLLRVKRMSPDQVLRLRPVTRAVIATSLLLAVSCSLIVAEADSLIQRLVPVPRFLHETLMELFATPGTWDIVLVFLAIVLLPGVCEEVFFRGVVLAGLSQRWGASAGVVTSALLFALLHFNPWQLTPLFLLGVVLGYLVVATHSLYPAILAHGANNLLSWISMRQTGRMDYQLPVWLVLLSIALCVVAFVAFNRATATSRQLSG